MRGKCDRDAAIYLHTFTNRREKWLIMQRLWYYVTLGHTFHHNRKDVWSNPEGSLSREDLTSFLILEDTNFKNTTFKELHNSVQTKCFLILGFLTNCNIFNFSEWWRYFQGIFLFFGTTILDSFLKHYRSTSQNGFNPLKLFTHCYKISLMRD